MEKIKFVDGWKQNNVLVQEEIIFLAYKLPKSLNSICRQSKALINQWMKICDHYLKANDDEEWGTD